MTTSNISKDINKNFENLKTEFNRRSLEFDKIIHEKTNDVKFQSFNQKMNNEKMNNEKIIINKNEGPIIFDDNNYVYKTDKDIIIYFQNMFNYNVPTTYKMYLNNDDKEGISIKNNAIYITNNLVKKNKKIKINILAIKNDTRNYNWGSINVTINS